MDAAGTAIRVLREAQGLRGSELAEMAGITKGYLSRIEHGKRNPTPETLRKITDALGRYAARRAA